MPRTRKRKLVEKTDRKTRNKTIKVDTSKNAVDESKRENLAEINNDIKIIRLTEDVLESDEIEDDEEDGDWEDVSDLDDRSDIIVNLDENLDGSSTKNDIKREQQKEAKEKQELIHKTHLLSLIGRVIFINKIITEELLKNLSLSCLSDCNIAVKKWHEPNLHELIINLANQFSLEDDESESGVVREILTASIDTHRVTKAWINVLLVSIVRSIGIRARIIAFLYPGSQRTNSKSPAESQPAILCPPTVHKPSTRNGSKKHKSFSSKSIISPENRRISSIEFALELLDTDSHKWIPFDGRMMDSWDNMSLVLRERRQFVYCVAIDNEGHVKNVAPKYDRLWTESVSRRQRVQEPVLASMLRSVAVSSESLEERIEDTDIHSRLVAQGIPKTQANMRGHPVFVARSHLLKYEVLHPDEQTTPFGRWRNEDVFLRNQVQLAHTRETWLKEAKTVRSGELPCKMVKTLSSHRKSAARGADPFVELFGPWQVDPYVPPIASDGIVPRNRFDNVDLFQPSMLPVGCSHLRYPELSKVATKLGIDCAPAMVGWAYTRGNLSRPVYDGWVVCNEYVDVLRTAVLSYRRDTQAKLAAHREKVVIKRWEVLTRRLLMKERIMTQYNLRRE